MTETIETVGAAPPSPEPATELRTFLFADVRGYTRFTQEWGDEAAAQLVAKFARLLLAGIRARGGQLLELRGDEALAVFGSARQALRAALELQSVFARETADDPSLPLPVGIGIHTGEAVRFDDEQTGSRGYRGDALNLAARLCNWAGPGEVLVSETVMHLNRRVQGLSYMERGMAEFKGYAEKVRVIRVVPEAEAVRPPVSDRGTDHLDAHGHREDVHLPIGGFLGALPSGALVGREEEWERLMLALDAVLQGSGRLVLLSGEPGIGKTRLAQEVTLKARHWDFLVATGRCYEQEQSVPYYPFLEALITIYNACPPNIRAEIPRRWPQLGRLLPDEIGLVPMATGDGLEDQQRLFRAVTQLLEEIAEEMPVAILLDDLHWADDSSLKLLQHLSRQTRGYRVLLLGTYRDVELHRQHPMETALLGFSREGLVEDISIKRLDLDGTKALVTEIIGEQSELDELAELVYRRTDGNAFFIQEILRALEERGDLYRRDNHWELRKIREMEVPKSVRSVIGQRLSQLSERAQEILREASVLGQTFRFDDVQSLGCHANAPRNGDGAAQASPADANRWTEDEIEDSLEQAMQTGLVRETGRDSYAFNHALTQQALYAEISTRRRKRLHRAAGMALERLPERERKQRAAELAWHFLEADDAEQALPYALLAGDQAEEVFANDEAERQYRTALELARELADQTHEVEAQEKLAGVLAIVARYDKALALLEQAAEYHHQAGDREAEGRVVAQIGQVHCQRGTADEGIARLIPVIQTIEAHPDGEPTKRALAALYTALARLYLSADMIAEQLDYAEKAMELAREVGDVRLLISAEVTRTTALWDLGRDDEAMRFMEDIIPRAEAAGDLSTLARALRNAAVYYARRGELEKDRTYLERALQVAERRGDRGQMVGASMLLSSNAFTLGEWDQARRYLDQAEAAIRSLSAARIANWPTAARGWMALREGDLKTAEEYGEQLLALAESVGDLEWQRHARRLLAERDLIAGDVEGAWKRLEPALGGALGKDDVGFWRVLAWVHLEMGNAHEAQDLIARAAELAMLQNNQTELVETLIVKGKIMAWQSDWDRAADYLETAIATAKAIPFPYGEARAQQEYGMMAALRGDIRDARRKLRRAHTLFQRLGAALDLDRVQKATALMNGDERHAEKVLT